MLTAGVLPKVLKAFFANGENCWPRSVPSNSLYIIEDDWRNPGAQNQRDLDITGFLTHWIWYEYQNELLQLYLFLEKIFSLNIKFSDGQSILEIECGMRAPVNSIIAANLKQIDDFLLSRNIYHPLLAIFLVTKEIQKNVQIW